MLQTLSGVLKDLGGEAAASDYNQPLARANEFGMRPPAAYCHFGRGRPFRGTGDYSNAQEHDRMGGIVTR